MAGYSGSAGCSKLNQANLNQRREKTYFKKDHGHLKLPPVHKKIEDIDGLALSKALKHIKAENQSERKIVLFRILLILAFLLGMSYCIIC